MWVEKLKELFDDIYEDGKAGTKNVKCLYYPIFKKLAKQNVWVSRAGIQSYIENTFKLENEVFGSGGIRLDHCWSQRFGKGENKDLLTELVEHDGENNGDKKNQFKLNPKYFEAVTKLLRECEYKFPDETVVKDCIQKRIDAMRNQVIIIDPLEITKYQAELEKVLKNKLQKSEEFTFGFQGGNFSITVNHNDVIWYATNLIGNEDKELRFWNGFGLYKDLNKNKSNNILVEINIPEKTNRSVQGAFVKNNNNDIDLIHRGKKPALLEWYSKKFPENVTTISDGKKTEVIIIIGSFYPSETTSPDEFINDLSEFINNVNEFKNENLSTLQNDETNEGENVMSVMPALNTILYGPPGTGKTFNTINKALKIIGETIEGKERKEIKEIFDKKMLEGRIVFTTFHQSMSYEDFIEGIKPKISNDNERSDNGGVIYHIENGIFKKLCSKADGDKENNFVLIIDEINRGNVSQIFGELITLIEEDKRLGKDEKLEVILPYSKSLFGVPSNVFIIGTMNTADRSVEALDAALRRRFSFEEMPPKPGSITNNPFDEDIGFNLSDILIIINKRIEKLLDKDHQIGHSYFMSAETMNIDGVKSVFQNKIIPLLQEYFFGDYGKIGLVLGEGFFEKENSKTTFADFKDYDSSDYSEKTIYKMKNVLEMEDSDFIKAISLLVK